MSVREFTPDQIRAIRSETHTLIDAGAGSGKTTTLVAKIMHALGAEVLPGERASYPCELSNIVAITFTEAAAADLKRELREAIRATARSTREPVWRRRIHELERARIGTIHAFCASVLREWGLRVGLDPRFRIVDETEAALLRREAARNGVLDALRDGDPLTADLVAGLGLSRTTREIERAMTNAETARTALARWCDGGEPRLGELEAVTTAAGFIWRDHDPRAAYLAARALRLACAARETLEARLLTDNTFDFDALITRARDLLRARPDVVAGLRRRLAWLFIDEFQDTDPLQREIAYRICGLPLTNESRVLEGPHPPSPSPNFGRGGRGVRAARGSLLAYSEIAVDGEAERIGGPRLCIVGDPKQSIYRFRRADVSVWNEVAADLAAAGIEPVPLDVNYRSRAPILGFVNSVFPGLMDSPFERGDATTRDIRYRPLSANRSLPGDDGLLEVLMVSGETKAEERRREEADRVARRMKQMVRGGEEVIHERRKDGTETLRAPAWRDMALLFRSRTAVPHYEEALRRHGIPFHRTTGTGFFRRREVRDLFLLLGALSDPRDDIAWAGLLRSPWVGLADESLLRLRLPPRGPLSRAIHRALPGAEGERLAHARVWLRELLYLRNRVRPSLLIERALDRSGYTESLLLREDGELALANLRKLVRLAEAGAGRSLGELVAWLREHADASRREPDAALHTAGEDVVTLTTVHGAKGLEWPIVFLCDLEKELATSKGHRPLLLFDSETGIALKLMDSEAPKGEQSCGGWERLCAREDALDRAEEKRVWYVAATRARDRLILCGCTELPELLEAPDAGRSAAAWLLHSMVREGERLAYAAAEARWAAVPISLPDGAHPTPTISAPLRPPGLTELAGAADLPARVVSRIAACPPTHRRWRHSASELMTLNRNPDDHRRRYVLGLPRSPGASDPKLAKMTGAGALSSTVVGTIIHQVLERLGAGEEPDDLIERTIRAEIGEANAATLPPETRVYLHRLIEQTRAHPGVARLLDTPGAERELPFTWFVDLDGEPAALRGSVDLVAIEDGAPEILDFKSHAIRPGGERRIANRYRVQRDVYAAALAELAGRTPASLSFFFPATGKQVTAHLDPERIARFRQRVAELLERLR